MSNEQTEKKLSQLASRASTDQNFKQKRSDAVASGEWNRDTRWYEATCGGGQGINLF
jgi:hypothetical protein